MRDSTGNAEVHRLLPHYNPRFITFSTSFLVAPAFEAHRLLAPTLHFPFWYTTGGVWVGGDLDLFREILSQTSLALTPLRTASY